MKDLSKTFLKRVTFEMILKRQRTLGDSGAHDALAGKRFNKFREGPYIVKEFGRVAKMKKKVIKPPRRWLLQKDF